MIHLIQGPMFSGKTKRMIELYKEKNPIAQYIKIDPTIANTQNKIIKSRYGNYTPGIHISNKIFHTYIIQEMKQEKTIFFIDEVQFLTIEDLNYINALSLYNFDFYLSGLNLNFKGERWEGIESIKYNKIEKLYSKCDICQSQSKYSYKKTENNNIIDTESEYIPLCQEHFKKAQETEISFLYKTKQNNKIYTLLKSTINLICIIMIIPIYYAIINSMVIVYKYYSFLFLLLSCIGLIGLILLRKEKDIDNKVSTRN